MISPKRIVRSSENSPVGRDVWCNELMDFLRQRECLCLNCGILNKCNIAKRLYEICKKKDLALAVTRCPLWEVKEDAMKFKPR